MRINDPKSLIFIDGIKGTSGVVEDFATITYVDKSINKNYGKVIWDIKDAMEVGSGIVWKQNSGNSDHPYKVSLQLDKEDTETKRYLDFNGEYTPAALRVKNISSDINDAKNEILTGALNDYNTANAVKNKFTGIDTKLAGINSSVTGYVSDKIYTNINGAVEAGRGLIITNTNNSDFPKALSINLESGGQTDKYLTLNGESVPGTLEVQGIDEAIATAKSEILTGVLAGYSTIGAVSGAINGLSNRITNIVADAISVSGSNTIEINQGTSGIQIISTKINSNDKVLSASTDGLLADIKLLSAITTTGYASSYKLVGKNGQQLGDTINIPKDQFLKAVEFIPSASSIDVAQGGEYPDEDQTPIVTFGKPCIKFTFNLDNGDSNLIYINVKDLIPEVYTAGNGITVSNNVISLNIAGNTIGGIKSGTDISVNESGSVTVLSAAQVKHNLSFVIPGESDTYYTFNGSNNKSVYPGTGIQFVIEDDNLTINSNITAASLGALTSVPLANGTTTVGGIKTGGDITVANGIVTVLSAAQVKHGITFNYPAGQADRITAETGIFNGSLNGSITPGNGIYFTYGQSTEDLVINADVNASTVTTSKNDVITGYLGFANTTKPAASATILSQMIAIQPVQFSTNQMSTSGNVYQREIIFDGESENVNFRKVYYDVSGYVFETIALDTNETFITEMQHLDNGNTRIFLDLPWDTSANKPIIRWEEQNEQRVGVTGKLSFKAVAFVNANGGKINVKSTINYDI